MNVIGDVRGKACILIDDMVDSGGTLCNAADALLLPRRQVRQRLRHPRRAVRRRGRADRRLQIESLTMTDSIQATDCRPHRARNIRQFTIAPILAEAMQRISDETSVSSLFD